MRRPTLLAASLVALMLAPAARAAVSFSPQTTYSVGTTPTAVAVGDFTGNGDPDLAAVNNPSGAGGVSVLLGASGAAFGAPTGYAIGNHPQSVAAGYFNGDGDLDLAVTSDAGVSV